MKLKEKLAKEYSQSIPCSPEDEPLAEMAFEAGFEKAREMTDIAISKMPFWMAQRDIKKIGEEEVGEG